MLFTGRLLNAQAGPSASRASAPSPFRSAARPGSPNSNSRRPSGHSTRLPSSASASAPPLSFSSSPSSPSHSSSSASPSSSSASPSSSSHSPSSSSASPSSSSAAPSSSTSPPSSRDRYRAPAAALPRGQPVPPSAARTQPPPPRNAFDLYKALSPRQKIAFGLFFGAAALAVQAIIDHSPEVKAISTETLDGVEVPQSVFEKRMAELQRKYAATNGTPGSEATPGAETGVAAGKAKSPVKMVIL